MKKITLFGALFAALGLAGCGGSGTNADGTSWGNLNLFIADEPSTSFDHVWVTLKKIELTGAGGSQTVFDDPQGTIVDLATLRDGTGSKFAFLSNPSVQAGSYSSVRATLDKNLVVFPSGAASGQNRVFAGFDADSGDKVLAATIPALQCGATPASMV